MSIVMILGGGVLEKCLSHEGMALMNVIGAFINQPDKDFPGGPVAKIHGAGAWSLCLVRKLDPAYCATETQCSQMNK